MKVLLIGNYENTGQVSMQQFAELLRRLLVMAGHEVRILRPEPILGRLIPAGLTIAKWLGYVDQFIFFPFLLLKQLKWADLVHICDQANAVYLPWLGKVPSVVTCHDVIAIRSAIGETPEQVTSISGRILQRWILGNLKKAKWVTCVSVQTYEELIRVTGINEWRVSVVSNALGFPYQPVDRQRVINISKEIKIASTGAYFLHVGGNQWYKNRLGVLRLFLELRKSSEYKDYSLVMVGKPLPSTLIDFIKENHLEPYVVEMPGIPNETLMALYSGAEALLFPSFYEGFGWPIIEAQACGCPVITTGRAPMTEVGGSACIYIDLDDDQKDARHIIESLRNRKKLIAAGFENASRFSEKAMLDGYLKVYQWALAGRQL